MHSESPEPLPQPQPSAEATAPVAPEAEAAPAAAPEAEAAPATAPATPAADSAADAAAPADAPPMSLDQCAAELKARFPALFGGAPKPLKLRIQADIQQRAPGVFTRKLLSIFLSRYTGSGAYLVAMGKATQRFDLDGQPAGEISAEHHEAAAQELTRRRALRKEREQQAEQARRAQWQAQQEQQRAEQQARRDRLQLLRAFENSSLTKANFCALKGLTPEALDAQLAQARQEAADWAAQQPAQAPRGDDRPPRRDDRPPRPTTARGRAPGRPRRPPAARPAG
jgi:ProP effector